MVSKGLPDEALPCVLDLGLHTMPFIITPFTNSFLVTARFSDFSDVDDSSSLRLACGDLGLEAPLPTGSPTEETVSAGEVDKRERSPSDLRTMALASRAAVGCCVVVARFILRAVCVGESGGSGETGTLTHRLDNNHNVSNMAWQRHPNSNGREGSKICKVCGRLPDIAFFLCF